MKSKGARRRSLNGPPQDEPWVWYTRDMLESDAWRAMPIGARRVLDRIVLENMAHAGTRNGSLIVTYDDFVDFGLASRRATASAIRTASQLGFIDIVEPGRRSFGGVRRPSQFGLTWLDRCDGTARSNRWRTIASRVEAKARVAGARLSPKPMPVVVPMIRQKARA
jgi:hypothetical protein